MRWPWHGSGGRIGIRLAVMTIVFSSVATLIITALQLAADYRQQVEDMERRLEEVHVLLPSFSASVWTFNDRQIQLGLKALVALPDFRHASIVTASGDGRWTEGTPPSPAIERIYPLDYATQGQTRRLGTLKVEASLHSIYRRLASRTLVLVGSNGVKTFLVAGFMLFLFRRMVTERLERLEDRMRELAPRMKLAPAAAPPPQAEGDEIDRLDAGFTTLSQQLSAAVGWLQRAEAELQDTNADLNRRVEERTTQLRTASQSLAEAKERAESAADAERRMRVELRNFLSMASHEFRIPLSIIDASTQLLALVDCSGETGREELDKIHRAVTRMTDLMDVCLDDERLDTGEIGLQPAATDLAALMDGLCGEFAGTTPGRIVLSTEGTPCPIAADAALLRIALSNLIDNALKYSPPATPVAVRLTFRETVVSIQVEDRGHGIAGDDMERIFEKYFRSARTDGVRGAGLGLHIVKRIVELHGGSIAVDSHHGSGTQVTMILPLRN